MEGKNPAIKLRAVEPEDLEVLFDWENRKSLWQVSNTLAPFSRFVLSKYLESAHQDIYQTRQLRLMIDLVIPGESQKTIGAIDLFDFEPLHQRAGVGILIAEQGDRGKGYASAALDELLEYCFNTLQLKQLYCNISTDNQTSLNLFKKHGFLEIGVKKQWNKTPDGFADEVMLQKIDKV